ncbi:hypothetical protein E4U56_007522, partial [Claviceps arundinis]
PTGRQQLEDDEDENEGEENSYSQGDDGEAGRSLRLVQIRVGKFVNPLRRKEELIESEKQPPQAYVKWPMQPENKRVGTELLLEEEDDDEEDGRR